MALLTTSYHAPDPKCRSEGVSTSFAYGSKPIVSGYSEDSYRGWGKVDRLLGLRLCDNLAQIFQWERNLRTRRRRLR